MAFRHKNLKIFTIVFLILAISALHYFTAPERMVRHTAYRMLFYLPLILGSFWFGLRGAVLVSAAATLFYLPYGIYRWRSFSYDFNLLFEGALYVFIALVLGYLAERERKAQAARLEAEKLAAIGRAVAEIAHDMKSPLMAIGGFVSQVSRRLQADEKSRKKLELAVSETARLEAMVKDMLDFGRPLELDRKPESVNGLAEECAAALVPVAQAGGVVLETDLDPKIAPQLLDRNRMKQVLVNLLTNAIQASPSGQSVQIRTRVEKGETVLEVSDCGCGITEEERARIFEPFYSTKKGGTGLGLSIVKKIVEAHGGTISLSSNPEGGVTFSVRLPTAQ
ncbi:sensor histidine kinase [Desulfatiglans anilini]|uniref:sensor histidine kinase n=1 Tax=Desulfatiglans anilini TaxID=90728 RepID=UPI000419D023|nr:ATP-binding protein [Desulfatiglans anilini]